MSAPLPKENSNTNPELDQLCINTIRALTLDAVQKAKSGHPGLPLGAAPMAYVLWTRFLRHNPKNPKWENLNSNPGAQYFWIERIFMFDQEQGSYIWQLFHTSRPGALDTSLVSSDEINNPRTMNALYHLAPRLDQARRWGQEMLAGGNLDNKQFNDYVASGPLTTFFQPPDTVWTPRVLKDGSDSVGALGALNRVFLNIGLFSEEWLLHFKPLIGGEPITPIEIRVARNNSSYWEATESQTPNLAQFFLKTTAPHKLKDAPGGDRYLPTDAPRLLRGKEVFAERCARCHSSKLPVPAVGLDPHGCAGKGYLDCWNKYWDWTKTEEFKSEMKKIVLADDFLENNFLSTDMRVPVTLLETNACSPLATNAIEGNIWDNFSSRSYKDLPSVGTITVHHPLTGEPRLYRMPAGGRGYTRPASLVSLWSTAPYLLNNSVGKFDPSPSVDARMQSFQNSIEQMLWPEKRDKDRVFGEKVPGMIDRTTVISYLRIPKGYLPKKIKELHIITKLLEPLAAELLPAYLGKDALVIGPIPAGTPVNLLANLDLEHADLITLGNVLVKLKLDTHILGRDATDEEILEGVNPLLELSKCPDFVVNRGHYFGTDRLNKEEQEPGLNDDDKRALIEFLKTM